MDDPEEVLAIKKVLASFYHYEEFARREVIQLKEHKLRSLTFEEAQLIPWFEQHLQTLEHCVRQNGEFCRKVATSMAPSWGVTDPPETWGSSNVTDYEKVKSVLKQIVREWSSEGKQERELAFQRFFEVMDEHHKDYETRQDVHVLVPGAGLGRLNYEYVKRGYWCQGNEFTYHMLLASNYILNYSYSTSADSIFPFIHSSSNQVSRKYQTRPIWLPDEHSSTELGELQKQHPTVPFGELMSIASGSFIDLYGPDGLSSSRHYSQEPPAMEYRRSVKSQFHYVLTNFFIDTAPNVIEYIKTIHNCLADDGVWINFGPLLWHYEDSQDVEEIMHPDGTRVSAPVSGLELCLDDLLELVGHWFTIEKRESGIECGYGTDYKAMGGWRYKCEFWVARKKKEVLVL